MSHILEHRQKSLLEAVPDTILHLNRKGILLGFKASAVALSGLSESGVGKNIRDSLPESLAEELLHYAALALRQGAPQTWSYPVQEHYQEARVVPVGPDEVAVFLRDITPQLQSEETLRQSEQYYRHLIQNLPCGVLIQSPSGKILLSNRTAEELLGLDESQLRGTTFTDLGLTIAAEADTSTAETWQAVHRAVTTGQPLQNLVLRVQPANSDFRIWLLVNIVPEKDVQGVTQYVVVTLSDVTDFKNAEAALSTSEEQYQSLVDSVQEVIFWIDVDDLWVFLNPAWQQITGFLLHESVGHRWLEFISPLDEARICRSLEHARNERLHEYRETFRLQTRDSSVRWVDLHARLMWAEDGAFMGMSGTLSDITERKLNEENTIRLAVQERSIEIQRRLLANLSHDIRTPLAVIANSAYLVRLRPDDAEKRHTYLIKIAEQIQLLTNMVERISTVARLAIGAVPFHGVTTHLNDLIQQVIIKRRDVIQVNRLALHLQLDPCLPPILADQRWIMEMLDNLLSNSIQYTPANGAIRITTSGSSGGVIIQLSDTGTGIAPEILPNIFEPFYKADQARSGTPGNSGLGLAIVKQVVDMHHGEIEVESEIGKGTTFQITLPAQAEHAPAYPLMLR